MLRGIIKLMYCRYNRNHITKTAAENCSSSMAADKANSEGLKEVTVPVVTSMTKYLFEHYRLDLYTFLNRQLRDGSLEKEIGSPIRCRNINKHICSFTDVSYWRINRLNFWADINVELKQIKKDGEDDWNGHLNLWISAEEHGDFQICIESLTTECQIETDDYPMLSPFLIPYFTNNRIDQEAERIWLEFLPEALSDPRKRNAKCLAERMGLSVVCLPLYKHRASDSLVQLVDTTFLVKKDDDPDEAEPQEIFVPANTIVINTNKVK